MNNKSIHEESSRHNELHMDITRDSFAMERMLVGAVESM